MEFSAITPIASLCVYGLTLIFAVFAGLIGLYRGIHKQTIRFVTVILSAVLAFFVCLAIYPALTRAFEGKTMADFIADLEKMGLSFGSTEQEATDMKNAIGSFNASMVTHVLALPVALLVTPLIYVVVFAIFKLLFIILHMILCGAFGFNKKKKNGLSRLGGMGLGMLQGVIVSMLTLMPFAGLLFTVSDAIDTTNANHPNSANAVVMADSYESNFGELENNLMMKLTDKCTGFVYGAYAKVEVDGEKIDLRDSVGAAVEMITILGEMADTDFNHMTEQDKADFSALTSTLYNDRYMATLTSDFLCGFATATERGFVIVDTGAGKDNPVQTFLDKFIAVFGTSTRDNLGGDLTTIENLFFMLSDAGASEKLSGESKDFFFEFARKDANGDTLFSKVSHEFEKNPRMSSLSSELTNLSMSLLLAGSNQNMEKAGEVINEVNETLDTINKINKDEYETHEEYKADVNQTIDTTLQKHGISLPADQVDELSDFMLEEVLKDKEEVTDADIADFMIKYYDLYASKGATIPAA